MTNHNFQKFTALLSIHRSQRIDVLQAICRSRLPGAWLWLRPATLPAAGIWSDLESPINEVRLAVSNFYGFLLDEFGMLSRRAGFSATAELSC